MATIQSVWMSGRPVCVASSAQTKWYFGRPFTYYTGALAYSLACDGGSMTMTGSTIGAFYGRKVGAAAGSIVMTGKELTALLHNKKISLGAGSYILTGGSVTLTYSGAVAVYRYHNPVITYPCFEKPD